MKYYHTFSFEKLARLFFVVFALVVCQANTGIAQCALSCNGSTQVSLSSDCDAVITPNMILSDNGAACPSPYLRVEVSDASGNIIPGVDVVTTVYMGQTLTVSVIDNDIATGAGSGNSCWGVIIIEDKFGPTIMGGCENMIMECADLASFPGPTFTDNCEGTLDAVLLTEEVVSCPSPEFIKTVIRTYSAVDSKGNVAANNCTLEISLNRFVFDNVTFPTDVAIQCDEASIYDTDWDGIEENEIPTSVTGAPLYIFELENGMMDTTELFPFPDVFCNTSVTFTDVVLPQIGCNQKIFRNWVVRIWECPNAVAGETEFSFRQTIEIIDDTPPVILKNSGGQCILSGGASSLTVSTNTIIPATGSGDYGNFNCGVSVSLCLPTATDNCLDLHSPSTGGNTNCSGAKNPDGLTFDFTYDTGFIANYTGEQIVLPMGTTVGVFTVYDECFNSSQCHIPIEIVDNTPPIAICDQNTTVSLTSAGSATVGASSFDDGSYDDCKEHCTLVRRMTQGTCDCGKADLCELRFLGNRNGSNYYLSDNNVSGTIARKRATAYGGTLVQFNDQDEETWVVNEVRRTYSDRFWTGVSRGPNGFQFDDHTLITSSSYTNWAPGQPSNGDGEDCVMVTPNNTWNDADCSMEWRYVIEISDSQCNFSSSINFCCQDVGNDQMVVFRVVDFYGNFNDCMVNVFVQDKAAPRLTCPPNRTVNCDYIFDANNLDASFGSLDVGESCGPNIVTTVDSDIRDCGTGNITRLFTAVDADGRELAHCKQVITFENLDPFQFDPQTQCPENEIFLTDCVDPSTLTPESIGTPDFLAGQCDRIGADFDDQLFTFSNTSGNPVCFKLIRTWTIIDWCQFNSNGTFRSWNCTQVIKVTDPSKPTARFSFEPNINFDDKGVPVFSVFDCEGGPASLSFSAEDGCTLPNDLQFSYAITGPDGKTSEPVNGNGASGTISGNFAVGSNTAHLTYYDNCGNSCTVYQEFIISNQKAPTAYCLSGVAVDIMPVSSTGGQIPDDGRIELWAADFDAGSFHPCGYPVYLSFTEDINDRNRLFTCIKTDALGNPILDANGIQQSGIGMQEVRIYVSTVTPDGSIVQTFCTTFVDIQNNHAVNPCPQFVTANVNGTISTETAQVLENVQVTLEGSNTDVYTDALGTYAFPAMGTGGDYIVDPVDNTDPLEGISTLDLVIIQRHILGVEELDSPYKIIAADINANNVVDGVDLVELRKLILGVYSEFPQNDSWRFIDKDYVFNNAESPLDEDFSEEYQIVNLGQNMTIDFVAIKVGDVDESVDDLLKGESIEARNSNSSTIISELRNAVVENEIVSMPFTVANSKSITGFQFEFDFDGTQIEIESVQGVNIDLNESNYNLKENSLALSWSDNSAVLDAKFEITFRTLNEVQLDEVFSINQISTIKAEVYDDNMRRHNLLMTPANATPQLVLQNNPNPFNSETELIFYLDQNSSTDIIISDVQGRVIKSTTQALEAGLNTMTLDKTDLGNPGIYYLTVRTDSQNEMIKLVLLD